MKKYTIVCLLFVVSIFYLSAQGLTGKDVMLKSKNREKPKTSSYKIEMTLINSRGNTRVREVSAYKKDYGSDEKSVMVFILIRLKKVLGFLQRLSGN